MKREKITERLLELAGQRFVLKITLADGRVFVAGYLRSDLKSERLMAGGYGIEEAPLMPEKIVSIDPLSRGTLVFEKHTPIPKEVGGPKLGWVSGEKTKNIEEENKNHPKK